MSFIVVRLRRGRLTHAVTEGADSPRQTLCGRYHADSAIVSTSPVSCGGCIAWLERHAKRR